MVRSFIYRGATAGSLAAACLSVSLPAAAAPEIVSSGTFEGRSDHVMSGGVLVMNTDAGVVVVLESDFFLDGAPDPKLGFGDDGYDPSTQFSPLESTTGAQVYLISSEEIDPDDYNEVWVWCEQFNVPLGVAKLDL